LLFVSKDDYLYLAPLLAFSTNVASYNGVVLCHFQSEAKWKLTPVFIAPAVWISDNSFSKRLLPLQCEKHHHKMHTKSDAFNKEWKNVLQFGVNNFQIHSSKF
jgi:hypothetical protein